MDISRLWIREIEAEKKTEIDRSMPAGCMDRRKILQGEENLFLRQNKLDKVEQRKDLFLQRVGPDHLLIG